MYLATYYMWCLSIYFLNNSQRIHSSSLICGAFIQVNFIIFSLINYFIKLMLSCTIPSFKHTCTNCMIYDLNSILRASQTTGFDSKTFSLTRGYFRPVLLDSHELSMNNIDQTLNARLKKIFGNLNMHVIYIHTKGSKLCYRSFIVFIV